MSEFSDLLEEYLGDVDDAMDIRATVRRLWHYSFADVDIRMWHGQGTLYTTDGNEWLGTRSPKGDFHDVPRLSDGRDGTAPMYQFGFGYVDKDTYNTLRTDQTQVFERPLTCSLCIFREGIDGLRPATPIAFFKQLTMQSSSFEEKLVRDGSSLVRRYKVTIIARDGNFGRSAVPGRTYADTMQKAYAKELGVTLDRGAEFLAGLANRTYKLPK